MYLKTQQSEHPFPIQPGDGILSAIGATPMVKLSRIYSDKPFTLYAKLEMLNPGGSIKDRVALNILKQAWERGDIDANSTIVEASSGNLGVGLAQACAILGLRFICVVDPRTTRQNLNLLASYGGQIDMVSAPDHETEGEVPACIRRISEHLANIPNSYWCNQYANLDNARAHFHTLREILNQCRENVDYLFCATSSCGTLRGTSIYINAMHLETKIISVGVAGDIIFGGSQQNRHIPGRGAEHIPELFEPGLQSEHICISDIECVRGCRQLLKQEGILAGGSSGALIAAICRYAPQIPAGSCCVAIMCDRGERYMDTVYDNGWVSRTLGYDLSGDAGDMLAIQGLPPRGE